MPKIRIFEQDNTGSSAVEDLAVVFVPGNVPLKDTVVDSFNCAYIPSTAGDLHEYFDIPSNQDLYEYTDTRTIMQVTHMVEILVSLGYGVVYQYVDPDAVSVVYKAVTITSETDFQNALLVYVPIELNTDTYIQSKYYVKDESGVYQICQDSVYTPGTQYYYQAGVGGLYKLEDSTYIPATEFEEGVSYYIQQMTRVEGLSTNADDWSFLNDKNDYNIKFITTGIQKDTFGTVPVSVETMDGFSNIQNTSKYAFDFSLANAILTIPRQRKDCALLLDLDYRAASKKIKINANELARDFKAALEFSMQDVDMVGDLADDYSTTYELTKVYTNPDLSTTCVSSRAVSFLSNCEFEYSDVNGTHILSVPASLAYLHRYAQLNKRSQNWLPISGVDRGVLEGFTPDIELSKYVLDNAIISDGAGVSFNGIVNVRSYGYTIWGDRTLIEQDAVRGVQATSYLSLRNLISDVAHTAYESAIRYTYETNNDATWMNFKQRIVTLLDQMVSSGVLQSYKINRNSADAARNQMIAVIVLYPVLPVENFDIYVNLENAEVTTTADEA